jgi:hypothetical protein
MSQPWAFTDAETTSCFTQKQIVHDGLPVLLVAHDEDDGYWQFLDGSERLEATDGVMVTLGSMVERDPTLADLADLPLGWLAWREKVGGPWYRVPNEGAEVDDTIAAE